MTALKEAPLGLADTAARLVELYRDNISFVLTGDATTGFGWYLPNVDVTPDQDDWIFHALQQGRSATLEGAITDLVLAARGWQR